MFEEEILYSRKNFDKNKIITQEEVGHKCQQPHKEF